MRSDGRDATGPFLSLTLITPQRKIIVMPLPETMRPPPETNGASLVKHPTPMFVPSTKSFRTFTDTPDGMSTLCRHSGLDEDVRSFVMDHPTTQEFMRRYTEMLDFLIPHYREEGKRRLVIAIGCTGGAHRSVARNVT